MALFHVPLKQTCTTNSRSKSAVCAACSELQGLAAQQQHPILCVAPEGLSQKLNFCQLEAFFGAEI